MNSHEVFIHIHQGCFAGTCQWSKPDGYGKISQCITTTKHSKVWYGCRRRGGWRDMFLVKIHKTSPLFLVKTTTVNITNAMSCSVDESLTPPQHEARARDWLSDWAWGTTLSEKIFLAEKKYITSGENYISCGEKYFLRRKIFLAEKNISCGKNIFLAEKNLFLAEKICFLRRKIYFLRRKIFLAEKNISCGKIYFLRRKIYFLRRKICFLWRKIYFLRRKIFLAEKKIFLAEKYFCTMLPISFRSKGSSGYGRSIRPSLEMFYPHESQVSICCGFFVSYFKVKTPRHQHVAGCLTVVIQIRRCSEFACVVVVTPQPLFAEQNTSCYAARL